MIKSLIAVLFCFSSLVATESRIIDLSDPTEFDTGRYDWTELGSQYDPFNHAIEFAIYFDYLKEKYGITTAVETGTWNGQTTKLLAHLFPEVCTIELNYFSYKNSVQQLSKSRNVHLYHGNSPEILSSILPARTNERVVFYLDAHWQAEWPLLNELEQISKTHKDNCIIVIDDFKVPGREDIPYDSYGGNDCSYEYVEKQLSKVFSSYTYHYLTPKHPSSRAKFVAIPNEW